MSVSVEKITMLFAVFSRRWSHRWAATANDVQARDVWRIDLHQLGITDEMVNVGLHASAALAWPPSPAEFAALCHSDDLPSAAAAMAAACHGHYPHQVVYEAARRVGLWNLRHWSDVQVRREFGPEYEAVCREYREGARFSLADLEAPALVHKAPPPVGVDAMEWERRLADLRRARQQQDARALGARYLAAMRAAVGGAPTDVALMTGGDAVGEVGDA